jgi:putative hydrolase of the HAD superfamily
VPAIQAIVFDLGGTLLDFPEWDTEVALRWRAAYDNLAAVRDGLPDAETWTRALLEAERAHWQRVDTEHWSGPPSGLVEDGYRRLGLRVDEETLHAVLDAAGCALGGWACPFDDTVPTLQLLRARGYRIGLLSNTWWAAAWHNADIATHGIDPYLDERVFTSDLPHSKPHPVAFQTIAGLLGVPPERCVMVGDRPVDDIGGGLGVGMRAVLKTNGSPPYVPPAIVPTAVIAQLAELPELIAAWG